MRFFVLYDNRAVTIFDLPARQRAQRRRGHGFARLQTETRMVPWTADRFADEETLDKRPMVVGAMR